MALAASGAVLYALWRAGAFLPRWIVWTKGSVCDDTGSYETTLAGKKVFVTRGGEKIWDSPEGV